MSLFYQRSLSWRRLSLIAGLVSTARTSVSAQSAFVHPLADTTLTVSYADYVPSACLAAVERVGAMAHRASGTRSESWNQSFLENDTILTVQRQTARHCIPQSPVATAAPIELPNLARLYWFIGDTARMQQAITRRLALDPTDSAKAVTYLQLLRRFLLTHQRDVRLVQQVILPGLDSLTSFNARLARLQAHAALAHTFASSRGTQAGDSVQSEIAAAMESFTNMPLFAQMVMIDTIGPLFQLGATEATEHGDTVRAQALLAYARQSLSRISTGADYVHQTEEVVRYFGMAAPSIHADFVYGAGPGVSADGPWPRPGRWTLIAPMPYSSDLADFYRHIHTIMGDTLDIVFYGTTHGSWWPRGPLTPSQEGTLMYDYLAHRWGIPGILLVETRPFHTLPDGRRMDDPTITPTLYANTGLLIDPHGTIRAMIASSTLAHFDRLLTAYLHPSEGGRGQ